MTRGKTGHTGRSLGVQRSKGQRAGRSTLPSLPALLLLTIASFFKPAPTVLLLLLSLLLLLLS